MTAVNDVLETLDYVTATAVASPAAETAIISTDVIQANVEQQPQNPNAPTISRPVTLEANINVLAGTGTTAVVVRCRQGVGTGGTQVGPSFTHTLGAGSTAQIHAKFRDTSGAPVAPGGTAYTITVAQTGSTVAGTVNAIDTEVKQ